MRLATELQGERGESASGWVRYKSGFGTGRDERGGLSKLKEHCCDETA